jgi:hypothetical protein
MLAFFRLLVTFVVNPFRSRRRVEIENLFLRHQLNIALRRAPHRLRLRASDRTLLVLMTWLWPGLIGLSRVVHRYDPAVASGRVPDLLALEIAGSAGKAEDRT